MSKTVVGLFSSMAEAEQVKKTLLSQGFTSQNVNVMANDSQGGTGVSDYDKTTQATGYDKTQSTGEGMGQKISNFFHGLTGGDEDVHNHYASGINNGGVLVAVTCADDAASSTAAILKQNGARDIETEGGYTANSGSANVTSGETAIPIIEEELVVGKREVDRGGVRVYSHVTEQPVSADVTLRDEKILVERRPVNRAATAADFNMGQGSMIELNATGEEAVVGKSARVVEEVLLGKSSSQRTEVVQDSVRKTEVEVEQIPGSTTVGKDRR